MSGHSKWHSIRHKKAVVDAKRGRLFTKLIREITVAARLGGGDPSANPRLRLAIERAKSANMPSENIKRAIMKGTGELPGVAYEEITYEGYGPGGVAVLVEVLTDNKNRTVAEIRKIFTRHNGKLGSSGCVSWLFEKRGVITLTDVKDEDELMEIAIENGAIDLKQDGETYEIITDPSDFESMKKALQDKNYKIEMAEITMLPKNTVRLEGKEAEQMLKLYNELDDHDDVQNVYANFDIPEEIMQKMST